MRWFILAALLALPAVADAEGAAPITPTVDMPANGATTGSRPPMSGSASANDTVTIYVDGAAFATTLADGGGSWSYQPAPGEELADGQHAIYVIATDASNNSSMSNSNGFVVDTGPPDTFIGSGPPLEGAPPTGVFSFTSDESPVSFECNVDGGVFVLCSTPTTVGPLGPGQHTFQVRAVDRAGNRDPSPASYTWIVGNDADAAVSPPDAEVPDAEVPDAEVPDAAVVIPDAPVVVPDAVVVDIDATPTNDASPRIDGQIGQADARAADAGNSDGAPSDGGPGDAGVKSDGGAADASIQGYTFKGGGCRLSGGDSGGGRGGWLFALAAAVLLLRRRRTPM